MGSPFTAHLIEAMAEDLRTGGPTADLVGDWPASAHADAVSLRLAGALHAAVLSGRDAALAAEYPSSARPTFDSTAVWRTARDFLARDRAWVAAFIRSAPQTNEPRRSIALLPGFLELAKRFDRVFDTLELGASAGLNLYWDRYAYRTDAWAWGGPSSVLIDTEWRGPPPPDGHPRVRARAACDLNPLALHRLEDRLRLRAYVWADQPDRLARLDAAVALALEHDVRVERADAASWLEAHLARRAPDALTVVYHSIFYQYPPLETRARIERALERAAAASSAPLAWLRVEPEALVGGPRESTRFLIDLTTWPDGERRILGATDGHVRFVDTRV
jgi:hypothetical protein